MNGKFHADSSLSIPLTRFYTPRSRLMHWQSISRRGLRVRDAPCASPPSPQRKTHKMTASDVCVIAIKTGCYAVWGGGGGSFTHAHACTRTEFRWKTSGGDRSEAQIIKAQNPPRCVSTADSARSCPLSAVLKRDPNSRPRICKRATTWLWGSGALGFQGFRVSGLQGFRVQLRNVIRLQREERIDLASGVLKVKCGGWG